MRSPWLLGAALVFANAASAEITLRPPIDCDLTDTCFIQQYQDHDFSRKAHDFRCAPLSYDRHRGTDFALKTWADMARGVNVLASASGTVIATRDGEEDGAFIRRPASIPGKRACGNAVILDHGNGWRTQYCHLKQGTVAVSEGQQVRQGTVLGQIGMSGRAAFPHVHLTVRKGDQIIDPFDPDGTITCDTPATQTLWADPPPYRPGGILMAGFADTIPEFDAIKAGSAAVSDLPETAPAIVLFGYAFGGRAGDIIRLRMEGPEKEVIREDVRLTKNQAQFFRAAGRKRTTERWPAGLYQGQVSLIRGGEVINQESASLRIK